MDFSPCLIHLWFFHFDFFVSLNKIKKRAMFFQLCQGLELFLIFSSTLLRNQNPKDQILRMIGGWCDLM